MDDKFHTAARAAFPAGSGAITLGAPMLDGACDPEALIHVPLAMLNRHGLIAGATGTGKTKTLQLIAEQLSSPGRAGVPRRREGRPVRDRRAGRATTRSRSARRTQASRGSRRGFRSSS